MANGTLMLGKEYRVSSKKIKDKKSFAAIPPIKAVTKD